MTKLIFFFYIFALNIGCGSGQNEHQLPPQNSKARTDAHTPSTEQNRYEQREVGYEEPIATGRAKRSESAQSSKASESLNVAHRICTAYKNHQMVGDKDMAFNQGQVLAQQGLKYSEKLITNIETICGAKP
jgi:hypothetical protein